MPLRRLGSVQSYSDWWDLAMRIGAQTVRRLRVAVLLLASLWLTSALGCSQSRYAFHDGLDRRVLPPTLDAIAPAAAPRKPADVEAGVVLARFGPPAGAIGAEPASGTIPVAPAAIEAVTGPAATLTLAEAIDTAFRLQPRLRVYLESVEQARRAEDIAFAPFLPVAATSYSVGGFNLDAGGVLPVTAGPIPGFAFLPGLGGLPFGTDIHTGYQLADLRLQWLLCDFGRRLGRYRQAGLAADIAQLQSDRAFQTVANEVAVAYYQLLRTRALRKTAIDAVRRAEDDLAVAKNLAKGGALEKEKVLRVEVQLADSQRLLDAAEEAEAVAVAALNLAIGLNVNAGTNVAEVSDIPSFAQTLADCLQTAVGQRREFRVARQSIQVADEGRRVARAEFAPRVVAEGLLFDFQQAAPRGHADLALGFIKLDWVLFEGGKRVAQTQITDSKLRAAVAQAQTVADTIAFQVTEAFRRMTTARLAIDRSRPAVTQAEENYRLVRARARQGDATSSEITDAESTLTRAQQANLNAIHDYLIALVRLEYAMGITPTPGHPCPPGPPLNGGGIPSPGT
jgi:outer membrane protein TolC